MVVIRIHSLASGGYATSIEGMYLKAFDPDALMGRGRVEGTLKLQEAMKFDTSQQAHEFWRQTSKEYPTRQDGRPNRPLTLYNIEILTVPS